MPLAQLVFVGRDVLGDPIPGVGLNGSTLMTPRNHVDVGLWLFDHQNGSNISILCGPEKWSVKSAIKDMRSTFLATETRKQHVLRRSPPTSAATDVGQVGPWSSRSNWDRNCHMVAIVDRYIFLHLKSYCWLIYCYCMLLLSTNFDWYVYSQSGLNLANNQYLSCFLWTERLQYVLFGFSDTLV